MLPYRRDLKNISRCLRKNMTDAELKLWSKLRSKQVNGVHFYRQKNIGNYIVDFYCPRARLIIEVDGSQHFNEEERSADRARDNYLSRLGFTVMRFNNNEVLTHIDGVLESIYNFVVKNPPRPPFRKGGGSAPLTPRSHFMKGGGSAPLIPRSHFMKGESSAALIPRGAAPITGGKDTLKGEALPLGNRIYSGKSVCP